MSAREPKVVVEQIVRDLTDFRDNIGTHYPSFMHLLDADEWQSIDTTIAALNKALRHRQRLTERSLWTDFASDVANEHDIITDD